MSTKLFIPSDILETLVCLTCNNYLSVFPVYTKVDSTGAVCGRCKVVEVDKFIRDEAYEGIAQYLLFPCRHINDGCKEQLTPLNLEDHELSCQYRKFDCPSKSYSKCQWRGSRLDLIEHFSDKHPVLLLKEAKFELNFVNSQEEHFLLPHGDELFIVKKEVDSRKAVFSCSIEHIKTIGTVDTFNYFLKFESADKNYRYKTSVKSTCDDEKLNSTQVMADILRERLEDPLSIIVNVHVIKAEIGTEVKDDTDEQSSQQKISHINLEMLAELECPVCYDYMLPPIFQCINGHSICKKCKPKIENKCPSCKGVVQDTKNFVLEKMTQHIIYPCTYQKNGCQYSCKSVEIRNHESSCEFGPYSCPLKEHTSCTWTGNHLDIAHHINNHNDYILNSDLVIVDLDKDEYEETYIIKFNKKIFKFYHRREEDIFNWCVQLVGPAHDADKYKFEIDIIDLGGYKRRCYFMGLVVAVTPKEECFSKPGMHVSASLQQIEPFIKDAINFRVRVLNE